MSEQERALGAPAAGSHKLPRHRVYKSVIGRQRHALLDAKTWNETHDTGAPVCVHRDNGEILPTKTRSAAQVLGDTAVVWVDGIAGAYALFRIHDRNGERSEPAEGRPSHESSIKTPRARESAPPSDSKG